MDKNIIVTIILISLTLISNGCLHNKLVLVSDENRNSALEKLNRTAKSREGRIALINGDTLHVKNIAIRGDSLFWYIKGIDSTAGASLSEIKTVSIIKRNTAKGLGHGLLIGAGTGAGIVGYLILKNPQPVADDCESFCIEKDEGFVAGILVFGVPMGFLGMLHGAATKTTDTYDFAYKRNERKVR